MATYDQPTAQWTRAIERIADRFLEALVVQKPAEEPPATAYAPSPAPNHKVMELQYALKDMRQRQELKRLQHKCRVHKSIIKRRDVAIQANGVQIRLLERQIEVLKAKLANAKTTPRDADDIDRALG